MLRGPRAAISLLSSLLLAATLAAQSGTVRYIYDELGRLVGVIDTNGDAAAYHYDAVETCSASRVPRPPPSPSSNSPPTAVRSAQLSRFTGPDQRDGRPEHRYVQRDDRVNHVGVDDNPGRLGPSGAS